MRRILIMLVMLVGIPMGIQAEDLDEYRYELENVKSVSSSAGYVTFKVWSYGRREKLTRNVCIRNAVHGILFKGLDANSTGSSGKVPALVPAGYNSHADYFDEFFKDAYLQYVQISTKGAQTIGDVIKITKKEYKVGMFVKVNINALRQRLEADGISASARSLFER